MRRRALPRHLLLTAAVATLLQACVVGPNYLGPPSIVGATTGAAFVRAAGNAVASPPAAQWWKALGSPELDQLEQSALATNPTLQVVRARLRRSRAGLRRRRADRLPTVDVKGLYLRGDVSTSALEGELAAFPGVSGVTAEQVVEAQTSADTVQLYDLGFDAAWELDLFGGQARALEGARAGIEAGEASVQDTEVSLTAEVAAAYVELRSLQQQLRLSLRTVQLEAQALTLGRQRFSGGIASDLDTERLNNQLQTTRALVAPIKAAISEQLDRIAVLLGRTPGSLDGILNSPGSVPLPPSTVAVGDAAALLRRRPDIRAAERRIQQQNASVGQHIAEFFPKVTLLGSIGFSGLDVGKTVIGDGASYAIAPGLQWTLFDFGRVGAEVAQARANSDEARAEYRETVLNALKEAETSLSRYANQRESLDELMRVQSSTDRSLALTKLRVKGGTATSLDLVEAESRRVQAAVNLAQASARLTQDYIALHKSLGLGWSPVT